MPDGKMRLDPTSRLVSACLTLLFGALALTLAVHLIRAIWPWLLGILLVSGGVAILTWFATSWRRRHQW